ncbi:MULTISPECIES: amino acid ABC transporter permease [Rhodococcus]|jgi:glutamate transport system permease protein|uniref:Amino acid ABC transporter permease n=1 Tax=Rhodococcus baikonurensis TaxID=172041 RepID=A0ABV5XF86_9NOCA|nr:MULTISPECIES: amino acid ABC transporter permease [Rhodococcus]MCY4670024.1 amino acid ABC transporter permease [Rhodococcus sp. (in: high G+C Gram-positive bacteria)]KLN69241.1 glutamate ABC transporter permease [Rhodococcus erythropolis]KSU81283.1 glutamate ABC transporter permease [Rhodococcus qingshengii]MBP2522691.1 glutamate transport system permease protein [Rhodococcus sp. PvP104]MBT2271991.1 amino acid ABC transporter permease [Rhodococcus qingshengii]
MTKQATVLYDAPGPKARALYRFASVVVAVLALAIAFVVYRALDDKGQLTSAKWDPFLQADVWTTYLLPGIKGTLIAAALSIVLALILGAILGIGRLSDHRAVRVVSGVIVELFRAIPVLLLIIFMYAVFAEYKIVKLDYLALSAVVVSLTLYNGSVIAEIVRSGINSLPRGQSEAAKALGMRKSQIMVTILLPQAVTTMLPALISQMVVALKDSALGYIIGYTELVRQSTQLGAAFQNYLPALMVAAVIMIILNSSLTYLATKVEKRLRSGKRKGKGPVAAPVGDAAVSVPGMDLTKP